MSLQFYAVHIDGLMVTWSCPISDRPAFVQKAFESVKKRTFIMTKVGDHVRLFS